MTTRPALSWIFAMSMLWVVDARAADRKIKPGDGFVFGSVTIVSSNYSGYRLYLRNIATDKRVAVLLDSTSTGRSNYRFAKSLKPGRYFVEAAGSPRVGWENSLTDESKFFDVSENTAVYLGHWTLLMTTQGTRYTVDYDNDEFLRIGESADVRQATMRKGLLGVAAPAQ